MHLSNRIIEEELRKCLNDINKQVAEVVSQAKDMGIEPHQLRNANGGWIMNELLVAKVSALHALTQLSLPVK